jgi:hypothetical protein
MINQVQLQKRKDFARDWRKELVDKYGKLPFMFSDENFFTVNGGLNRQNDRVFALSREQANMNGVHHRYLDEDEIKKSIQSFTKRVREVEKSNGKCIQK